MPSKEDASLDAARPLRRGAVMREVAGRFARRNKASRGTHDGQPFPMATFTFRLLSLPLLETDRRRCDDI